MSELKVGWQAGPTERGTLSIVYSCLVTMFACTWTILHLNVPGHNEKWQTKALRKAKWMAITILLPEFILAKAVCDLRLALNDLRELHEYMEEMAKLEWRHGSKSIDPSRTLEHFWSWHIEYSPRARILYRILGLRLPRLQSKFGAEETIELDKKTSAARTTTNSQEGISSQDPTKKNPRHHYQEERSTQGPAERARPDHDTIHGRSMRSGSPTDDRQIMEKNASPCENEGTTQATQEKSTKGVSDQMSESAENENVDDNANQTSLKIRQVPKPQSWTLAHAYLANMGGLTYLRDPYPVPESEYWVVTGLQLSHRYDWLHGHPLLGLVLSKEDIEDKSKADWLLKGLTVVQITWLVLTVLTRAIKHLPLTQLEIATLSFSILAIITYAANWWKPKDVSRPFLLPNDNCGYLIDDADNPIQRFTQRLRAPTKSRKEASGFQNEHRVENDVVWMEEGMPLIFSIMAVSSLVFGGFHCIAWNFQFPSRVESILWRICNVMSMILPVLSLAFSLYMNYLANAHIDKVLTSFLLENMKPLDKLHGDYLKEVQNPYFMTWTLGEQAKLLSIPADSRNFDQKPSLEPWEREQESVWETYEDLRSRITGYRSRVELNILNIHYWKNPYLIGGNHTFSVLDLLEKLTMSRLDNDKEMQEL